ncbi:hypothetical protein H0G86_003352 [Trichoderma simmonsii]|uniref:Uncharacterized protein n=1 Tax=Trichoderma simmonsii TaxID=1491479 RepID=A0A8G0L7I3_9HYPO|nr:hypothetical protein H0G86_003352 [Trichoderma simmonsii]
MRHQHSFSSLFSCLTEIERSALLDPSAGFGITTVHRFPLTCTRHLRSNRYTIVKSLAKLSRSRRKLYHERAISDCTFFSPSPCLATLRLLFLIPPPLFRQSSPTT